MEKSFKSCFVIAFLSAVSVGLTLGHLSEYAETQLHYWNTMLPITPMPQSLLDALPNSGKDDGMEDASIESFLNRGLYNETATFILEKDLISGANLNIQIPLKNNMRGPRFPSPQMAKKMPPLTSTNLPQILELFSVSPNSHTAEIINKTLAKCEKPEAFIGGIQFCATSLVKMVNLVTSRFGDSQRIRAISMPTLRSDNTSLAYKIMDARKIAGDQSSIGCHMWNFPVRLYYCHQPRGTAAYAVSLVGEDTGVKIDAYAMCHAHPSAWFTKDIFTKLNVKNGTKLCHINHLDDVIWYKV